MPPTTSRIACLRIPDFPIAAHRRAEGKVPGARSTARVRQRRTKASSDSARELRSAEPPTLPDPSGAAIVVRGEGKRALVAAASEEARRHEIAVGMRAADARAQLPGLREWEWSPALYDEVQTELAAALLAASPRVSRAGLGAFWLDAGGWDRLGGEEAFVEAARSAALAAGYPEARLGIAGTAAAARAATRLDGYAVHRVPPGDDARFLAPLPLDVLPISEDLFELLEALGLETVGALAALPAGEVEARLGAGGVQAHGWARGLEDGREGPFGGAPRGDWTVEVEFPGPVERLEPLLFLLKSCLDHLSDALAAEGLCLRGLELTIATEEGAIRETVRPARPTRQVAMLLSLCRAALDGLQVPGRALGIRVEAEEVVPAMAEQSDLFEPPRPDPDALATALSKLQGRWGPDSVVQAAAADSHRPEKQGRWEPVDLMTELARRAVLDGNGSASLPAEAPALVLRLWPRPRRLDVHVERGQLGALLVDGGWRAVEQLKGPERLSGEWWEDHYRREYYRVSTIAGDLLWVFYDPRRRGWFWHGWWD